MRKENQDVVMTALSKYFYYLSRILHIILLPILYVGILWYPVGRPWEYAGLLMLAILPFYSFGMEDDKKLLFKTRIISYIIIIALFFPIEFFKSVDIDDYRSLVFFDIAFMFSIDLWIYIKDKSILKNSS